MAPEVKAHQLEYSCRGFGSMKLPMEILKERREKGTGLCWDNSKMQRNAPWNSKAPRRRKKEASRGGGGGGGGLAGVGGEPAAGCGRGAPVASRALARNEHHRFFDTGVVVYVEFCVFIIIFFYVFQQKKIIIFF